MSALLVAGLLTASSPSVTACLWRRTPEATRSAFAHAYARGGLNALLERGVSDAEIRRLAQACGPRRAVASTERLQATGVALVGLALQHAASEALSAQEGVAPARFARAWRGLSPDDRQVLREAYEPAADASGPPAALTSAILLRAVRGAGYRRTPDDPADARRLRLYGDVFLGMAQAEAGGARFARAGAP